MIISFALFTRLLPSAYRQSPVTPGDQLCLLRIPTHIYFRLVRIKDTIIFFLSLSLSHSILFYLSLSFIFTSLFIYCVKPSREITGRRNRSQAGAPRSSSFAAINWDRFWQVVFLYIHARRRSTLPPSIRTTSPAPFSRARVVPLDSGRRRS